jgi:hypothetical protein
MEITFQSNPRPDAEMPTTCNFEPIQFGSMCDLNWWMVGIWEVDFRIAKNYRSKSVWTLFQRKLLNNQTVWPVIFGFSGPICARALKSFHLLELRPRGHHDWPVKPVNRTLRLGQASL